LSQIVRRRIGFRSLLMVSALSGLLFALAGCGTFEVRGQLVTPTSTSALATDTPATSDIGVTAVPVGDEARLTTGSENDHLHVPRLDDAQVIVDIRTRLIYRSESDMDTALTFYARQMPLDGWIQVDATRGETDALLTFSRGDETVTITITEDWLGLTVEAQSQ